MDTLAQGYSAREKILFLLVHMLQGELLLVLLGTSLAALLLYNAYKKQNNRNTEQVFSRNIAAASILMALVIWLAGRMLR